MKSQISLILIVSNLLYSCATVPYEKTADGQLDKFIDQDIKFAIMHLGPPTNVYSDGADGRILAWEDKRTITTPAISYSTDSGNITVGESEVDYTSQGMTLTKPPTTYTNISFVQLYADSKGTIYHYRHNTKSEAEIKAEETNEVIGVYAIIGGVGIAAIALTAATE